MIGFVKYAYHHPKFFGPIAAFSALCASGMVYMVLDVLK